MSKSIKNSLEPFDNPITVTKPLLPDLAKLNEALKDIWQTKWVTNGGIKVFKAGYMTKLYELENRLRRYLKVPGITIFNNGTTALIVAIRKLFTSGEVITTPFTFAATIHALTWNNITPVFCDIDETTLTLDINKIEQLITEKTTGILGVHVYGMPCHVREIDRLAKKYNLKILYDAAHAFGTEIDGKGIGTFGDLTMFSFHATKLFNTIEGGALTYNNEESDTIFDLYRDFGIRSEGDVVLPGINGKMNEIQAMIGLLNLQIVEEERKKRQRIIDIYCQLLSGISGIDIVKIPKNIISSLQYFVIRINKEFGLSRDEVYNNFRKYNVLTRKYFYPLCSEFECYKQLPSSGIKNLPIANKIAGEVLCLPLYGDLRIQEVEKICWLLHQFK